MQITKKRVCPSPGCRNEVIGDIERSLRRFGSSYRCSFCSTAWRGAVFRADSAVLVLGLVLMVFLAMTGYANETGKVVGLVVLIVLYLLGSRIVLFRTTWEVEAKEPREIPAVQAPV
ncbi:MAG: hypothetical protein Q8Q38_00395 [bacterium]|nr:hypothetical protein [bacterium]